MLRQIKIPLLFLAIVLSCSNPTPTKSDSTPTTTGRVVKGKLLNESNQPISGAIVRIYSVDFVPSLGTGKRSASSPETTDTNGEFEIPNVDSGTYNIEAEMDSLAGFIDSVKVGKDTIDVKVPDKVLKKFGKITGISHMAGQNDTNQVRVTLYIPGTRRITKPIIGGRFSFDAVPEGSYQIIVDPTLSDYNVKIMNVSVSAGITKDLDTVMIEKIIPDTIDIKATSVSGVWEPTSIYRIYNKIEVPSGATLTVKPGTHVLFMGYFSMWIYGSFVSVGTQDSLIVYEYGLVYEYGFENGTWDRIRATPTVESFSISYSIIEDSETGLTLAECTIPITVSNCVFRNGGSGVWAGNCTGGVNVFNSIFHDITGSTGHRSSGLRFYIRDNDFTVVLKNNIVLSCSTGTFVHQIGTGNLTLNISNNCYYNNNADFITQNGTESVFTPATTGHVTADPKFTGITKGSEDYHLQSSSPCKGTGVSGTDMGIYSTYKP